jgi:hypothetical protein
MKTVLIVSCLLLLILSSGIHSAEAKDGLGLGIIIGEPTGLSLKKWLSVNRAFAAGVAWSFSSDATFHFHADYLIHRFDLIRTPELEGRLPLYYGIGARFRLKDDNKRRDNDDKLGIRFPLGITYLPLRAPLDVFLEIVPILDIVPDTSVGFNAAIGVRYYF